MRLDTQRSARATRSRAADYLKQVLEREGIPVEVFALEAAPAERRRAAEGHRRKRPLLIMGHTDVVNVDPDEVDAPAVRRRRATAATSTAAAPSTTRTTSSAALMTMLLLKRLNVPLDRDVIFLAEAGEEGSDARRHRVHGRAALPEDRRGVLPRRRRRRDARRAARCKFASVQTLEKMPRSASSWSRSGVAGHGSVPLQTNRDRALVGGGRPASRRGSRRCASTTRRARTSRGWPTISTPADARALPRHPRSGPEASQAADEYFLEHEPRHASMLRTSISPNILQGGYRINVIPSEATATLDVRMLPDEDPRAFLAEVSRIVNDPAIEVRFGGRATSGRARAAPSSTRRRSRRSRPRSRKHYDTVTLPR